MEHSTKIVNDYITSDVSLVESMWDIVTILVHKVIFPKAKTHTNFVAILNILSKQAMKTCSKFSCVSVTNASMARCLFLVCNTNMMCSLATY